MIRFRAKIEIRGINPYVLVIPAQARRLQPDWRKPMPVRVQVNGAPETPHSVNLMPAGDGSFYLYLDQRIRVASHTNVGDSVQIALAFDRDYRSDPEPIPRWFSTALRSNPAARKGWTALQPSRKKEVLRYLTRLKSAEARTRNIEKALHVLAGGTGRFMARDWNSVASRP